jgi:manganese/zinc/iron transport system substrate-binding protein
LILGLFLGSCSAPEKANKPLILVTTGMIEDAVVALSGDCAEVVALMGAGIDPHSYKASRNDAALFNKADIIIHNGFHLEGKLAEVFQKLSLQKPVFSMADYFPQERKLIVDSRGQIIDPHIWFDAPGWARAVEGLSNALSDELPDCKNQILKSGKAYKDSLIALNQTLQEMILSIPAEQRILITSHDAFHYMGREYGLEVKALQGISTVAEYGLQDMTQLVQFISERKIKSVFIESSVSDKALRSVIEGCKKNGHQVSVGGTLYSDALGEKGSEQGTYFGALKHNIRIITQALK